MRAAGLPAQQQRESLVIASRSPGARRGHPPQPAARLITPTDLPSGLLIAVVVGTGQAMDTWMLTQRLEEEALSHLISVLI
jgi:hypothetical protein